MTSQGIQLNNGALVIRGNSAVPTSEVVNRFGLFTGTITLENNGQNVSLTSGQMFRASAQSVGLIRGTNLGATPSNTSTNYFAIDMGGGSTQLAEAGGAAGSSFINIVPGVMGDQSSAGVGTDLMTYDSAVGFRLLTPNEYHPNFATTNFDGSRAPNVAVVGPAFAPKTTSWVTALKLDKGTVNTPASIDLRQSTVLTLGNGPSIINSTSLRSDGNGGHCFLTAGAGATLTVNAALPSGAIFKYGTGTLQIANAQTGTGQVYVGEGTLRLSGANASLHPVNGAVTVAAAATFDLGGFDRTIDSLTNTAGNGGTLRFNNSTSQGVVVRGNWTTSRMLHSTGPQLVNTAGFDATLNGPIVATTSTLTKSGQGTLTITHPAMFTTGNLVLNACELRLRHRGGVTGSGSQSLGFGTRFVLDDTGVHFGDRISDNAGGITGNNAEIQLLGNAGIPTEEIINNLTLGVASTVTIQPGSGQAAILRLGAAGVLARSNNCSILFRGTNLGVNAPGTANTASLMLFNPLLSTGALTGGGLPGTTILSIIGGAFGDTSATGTGTGTGTQLVTYDLTNGIRLLNPSEYASTLNNGTVMSDNVCLNATSTSIANPTTVNALWMDTGSTLSGAGTLTIFAGNILVTGTGNTISAVVTVPTNFALAVGGPGDLTISSNISRAAGGLIKTGSGTLTLNGTNGFAGSVTLASGTLVAGSATALGAAATRILGGTRPLVLPASPSPTQSISPVT